MQRLFPKSVWYLVYDLLLFVFRALQIEILEPH